MFLVEAPAVQLHMLPWLLIDIHTFSRFDCDILLIFRLQVVAWLVSKWPQSLHPPDHAPLLSVLAQMLRKNKRWVLYKGRGSSLYKLLWLLNRGRKFNVIHNFGLSLNIHAPWSLVFRQLPDNWVFVISGWCVWGGCWCVCMPWLCTPLLSLSLLPSPFLPFLLLPISHVPLLLL